jgi:O-antigen/teichoic acid export membrane protein
MTTLERRTTIRSPRSGAGSGALIAAASLLATAFNYLFLLASGRLLGTEDYGALAALLGLLTVILLPTGALQLAVAREVSRLHAIGDSPEADGFGRAMLKLGSILTVPLVVVALLLVQPAADVLGIDSIAAVALAALAVSVALVLPITIGVLQGEHRFGAVSVLYVLPFGLRLALLVVVAALGAYTLGGAVLSAVGGAIASAAVALWLVRSSVARGSVVAKPNLRPFFHYLWPVVLGLLGIAVLTNGDLVIVKARFSPAEASDYAVASAFARVAFFMPATILAVLFPRTAARQARGDETADILGRTLIVTAAFCALLIACYATVGEKLIELSFGDEFANADALLPGLTFSMMLFSLANVLVGFHLSRNEVRYAWFVAGAVVVQVIALVFVPNDPQGVVWVNVAIGCGLLLAHEVFVGSSVPALLAGVRRLR